MRIVVLVVILAFTWLSCGGVRRVAVDFHLPGPAAAIGTDDDYVSGWEALERGEADAALASFRRSRAPAALTLAAQGYALMALKRWGDAHRQFEAALRQDPRGRQAAIGLAILADLQGDREKAFQAFGRLLAETPDEAWLRLRYDALKLAGTEAALRRAEAAKAAGDGAGTLRALQQGAYFSPEMVAIQQQIADTLFAAGDFLQALPCYEKLLDRQPHNAELLLRLADVYERLGKFDSALLALNRLLAFRPGDAALEGRRASIRERFLAQDMPPRFKNLFFKEAINREDLAALIGLYFGRHIPIAGEPLIVTDIAGSYAQEQIVRVASAGIMPLRPDHSFARASAPDRADFAVTLRRLIDHLEKRRGLSLHIPLAAERFDPADVTPLHKEFATISFLVNAGILSLDPERNFNPTAAVTADEAVFALKRILHGLPD